MLFFKVSCPNIFCWLKPLSCWIEILLTTGTKILPRIYLFKNHIKSHAQTVSAVATLFESINNLGWNPSWKKMELKSKSIFYLLVVTAVFNLILLLIDLVTYCWENMWRWYQRMGICTERLSQLGYWYWSTP